MNPSLYSTAVLAMTADGKITDFRNSAARFGSANDKIHLEQQISLADGVLFGAATLRSYGTTMSVSDPILLNQRRKRSQPPQPIQIVVSASGNLDPQLRFFQQPVPRWLLTVPSGAKSWRSQAGFERILVISHTSEHKSTIDWSSAFIQLQELGLEKLAILGGGELVASLLAADLINELWLTICPFIFGGNAPTPVGGTGFIQSQAKKLQLLETKQVEQEVFLHYLIKK